MSCSQTVVLVGEHLCGLVCRNLCPCVLKYDDNATELASLVEVNKKYQVSWELLCGSWFWLEKEQTLRLFQPRLHVTLPLTSLQI